MIESKERTLPGIINIPLRWFRGRWNEAYYGFEGGKVKRERMETLLGQPAVSRGNLTELLNLITETHDSSLQVRMAEKVEEGTNQLVGSRRLPRLDVQALSEHIERVAREEELE